MSSRQFLQRASESRSGVRELLQLLFAAELVAPSRTLWIVSPWLRDIPVLDNTSGAFMPLSADLPRTNVRLSRILRELVTRGSRIVIATRPESGNRQVVDALEDLRQDGDASAVVCYEREELHAKGILGDRCCLSGSMNFTFNGLERLTELLAFETDPRRLAELRLAFAGEYRVDREV